MQRVKSPLVGRAQSLRSGWWLPASLIALTAVPALAGSIRLAQIATGGAGVGDASLHAHSPAPLVIHLVAACIFGILGALQVAPALRRTKWHRAAGMVVLPCGVFAALTGLWMTQFNPLLASDSALLYCIRVVVALAMLACLGMAAAAVREQSFRAHGAWMIRAYALGMGAGTQVFTHLPWFLLVGTPGPFSRALLMGAGWLINIVVAEVIIRRRMPTAIGWRDRTPADG